MRRLSRGDVLAAERLDEIARALATAGYREAALLVGAAALSLTTSPPELLRLQLVVDNVRPASRGPARARRSKT